jgi:hypothetical protein
VESVLALNDTRSSRSAQVFSPFHPSQSAAIASKSAAGDPFRYDDASARPVNQGVRTEISNSVSLDTAPRRLNVSSEPSSGDLTVKVSKMSFNVEASGRRRRSDGPKCYTDWNASWFAATYSASLANTDSSPHTLRLSFTNGWLSSSRTFSSHC